MPNLLLHDFSGTQTHNGIRKTPRSLTTVKHANLREQLPLPQYSDGTKANIIAILRKWKWSANQPNRRNVANYYLQLL